MVKLRTYLIKLLLLVIAIQILNLSVYGRDCDDDCLELSATIGDVNEMDSITEYVAEVLLDQKNLFPESGHHNRRSGMPHQAKHIVFKMVSIKRRQFEQPFYFTSAKAKILSKVDYKYLYAREITPPPPKA